MNWRIIDIYTPLHTDIIDCETELSNIAITQLVS